LVGVSRQPSRFMNVDFPEPEGPITATNSPAAMSRLTPRRAWTRCSPSRYVFTRSRTAMSAGPSGEVMASESEARATRGSRAPRAGRRPDEDFLARLQIPRDDLGVCPVRQPHHDGYRLRLAVRSADVDAGRRRGRRGPPLLRTLERVDLLLLIGRQDRADLLSHLGPRAAPLSGRGLVVAPLVPRGRERLARFLQDCVELALLILGEGEVPPQRGAHLAEPAAAGTAGSRSGACCPTRSTRRRPGARVVGW